MIKAATLNTAKKIIALAGSGVALLATVFSTAKDIESANNERKKGEVLIPVLDDPKFPMTVAATEKILEAYNLTMVATEIPLTEASPKFKDYTHTQIVASKPAGNKRVLVGSVVQVRYITQEVIDKSNELYQQEQRDKEETREKNKEKRAEILEKTKIIVANTSDKVKGKIVRKKHENEKGESE